MRAILLSTCRIRFKKLYLDCALGNNNVIVILKHIIHFEKVILLKYYFTKNTLYFYFFLLYFTYIYFYFYNINITIKMNPLNRKANFAIFSTLKYVKILIELHDAILRFRNTPYRAVSLRVDEQIICLKFEHSSRIRESLAASDRRLRSEAFSRRFGYPRRLKRPSKCS